MLVQYSRSSNTQFKLHINRHYSSSACFTFENKSNYDVKSFLEIRKFLTSWEVWQMFVNLVNMKKYGFHQIVHIMSKHKPINTSCFWRYILIYNFDIMVAKNIHFLVQSVSLSLYISVSLYIFQSLILYISISSRLYGHPSSRLAKECHLGLINSYKAQTCVILKIVRAEVSHSFWEREHNLLWSTVLTILILIFITYNCKDNVL